MKWTRQRRQLAPVNTSAIACFSPPMGFGDHEPGATKPSLGETAQERKPEVVALRRPHVEAEDLALTALVDAHGDDGDLALDASAVTNLHAFPVQPDVGVLALQLAELLHAGVQLTARP